MSDGTYEAVAGSIVVYNDDVYVAGTVYLSGVPTATYWKNGSPVYLSNGTIETHGHTIFVHNGDIYVSGDESYSGLEHGIVWKNGTAVSPFSGIDPAINIHSIYVR